MQTNQKHITRGEIEILKKPALNHLPEAPPIFHPKTNNSNDKKFNNNSNNNHNNIEDSM